MKVTLVHPGASWSVSDVHRGIAGAFRRANVDLVHYAMEGHIAHSARFLKAVGKEAQRYNPGIEIPNAADYLYHASLGIIERALRHQSDWVFIISGTYIHPQVLDLLRRAGIRTACLLTESPYADDQERLIASLVDVVFTNERTSLSTFVDLCHEVYYYQHAHDPEYHYVTEETNDEPAHDVVFVGTGFEERCDLLSAINWDGIDLGLYGTWRLLGSRSRMRQYVLGDVIPNERTARLYHNAKIGLNLHRTSIGYGRGVEHVADAESMNPRCYELAATGTFTLTDNRAEVAEVFGDAMPTFADANDLEAKIRYYLAQPDERRRLAARARDLVAPHVFDDRAAHILAILNKNNYILGG